MSIMQRLGCEHYKRKVKFRTPCCRNIYTCRFCHDEKEDHPLDRKNVTLICATCYTPQRVNSHCHRCHTLFGKYSCLKCRLFDDEDKGQFHCDGCGICRVGGRDNFFHCNTCNLCLPNNLQISHKCVENASRCPCPLCLEELHTSRDTVDVPGCGHLIHRACKKNWLESGRYTCPTCQRSFINMTKVWKRYDQEIQNSPMPKGFKDKVDITCRDCQKTSTVPYHVVGLKCKKCGSYNTAQV